MNNPYSSYPSNFRKGGIRSMNAKRHKNPQYTFIGGFVIATVVGILIGLMF